MSDRWNPVPLVFLGPSLSRAEAERLCEADYHAPVARGALPELAGAVPRAVVIIDGRFAQARAVSPKEILATIDAGHALFGAASMGALRAVELERFGMRGVGRIYEAFRSGELTADDEVAVGYDPHTLRSLSDPLVNIRVALSEAEAAGVLAGEESAALLEVACGLHYWMRTYSALVAASTLPQARRARLLRFLSNQATDQKAEDARGVLRYVASLAGRPSAGDGAAFDLPLRAQPPRPQPALDAFPPALKWGGADCVRTVPAAATEQRLARVRAQVGITRVADVTGLDVLGVPNFIAVRPSRDRLCNSAYSGKSLSPVEARVGAQMEALEVACGHDDRVAMHSASYAELAACSRRAVHPDSLIPCYDAPADLTSVRLEWVTGWEIENGAALMVPADAVFFRRNGRPAPWKISSNGLASGNTFAEAIAHGLAELIERDAETMFRLATEYAQFPALLAAVAGPTRMAPPPGALPAPREFPLVRTATLPRALAGLVARFRDRGLRVAVRCITSDVAVPVLLCAIHERTHDQRRHLVHYGCGAHPDPRIAARRAVTEAAQSRVTAIQGSREDLQAGSLEPVDPPDEWFDAQAAAIDFGELPVAAHADIRDDIRFMIERLKAAGLSDFVAVDLSNPALEFPVVKVLVPGLELAFHALESDRLSFGWRARRFFAAAFDLASTGDAVAHRSRPPSLTPALNHGARP